MLDFFGQPIRQLLGEGRKTCRDQVELHSAISVCRCGGEYLGRMGKGIGASKDGWIHQTAPVTSASTILAPEATDCPIAVMARTEATPSSMSAPRMGFAYRMVSAKPSS